MQILVGRQAELLFEAGGKAAGGVITAGEGDLQRGQALLQQVEGVAHAHLSQQLAKAATFGGQLAHHGGAAHGEVGGHRLQGMIDAGFHRQVACQPLCEGHGAGGKEQSEGVGGPQLGIEAAQ